MDRNRDYNKDLRFEKINELLNDDSIDNILGKDKLYDKGSEFSGSINLTFDPLKMKAFLEIKSPANSSAEITYDDVKDVIYKSEIERSSIDWDVVKKIYSKVIVQEKSCSSILIAQGHKVVPHIPEHIIPKSSLEAYGTVYPGTYIEICHVSYAVTEELHMVRFSLKKELGEIVVESIG